MTRNLFIRKDDSIPHFSFRRFLTVYRTSCVYKENLMSCSYGTFSSIVDETPVSLCSPPLSSSMSGRLVGSSLYELSSQQRRWISHTTGTLGQSSYPTITASTMLSNMREMNVYNASMSNMPVQCRMDSPLVSGTTIPEFHMPHISSAYRPLDEDRTKKIVAMKDCHPSYQIDINGKADLSLTEAASNTLMLWPSPHDNIDCADRPNRIIMLASSINDHTKWPIWKHMQMRKVADELHKKKKQSIDWVMLAFQDTGAFEARVSYQYHTDSTGCVVGGPHHQFNILSNMTTFCPEILKEFLDRWHLPGKTYFVYGGHGMGDYLELEQNKITLQCHQLSEIMGEKKYEAILMDACFMANLDNVYHLRRNTQYIGACEGYMWEPDNQLESHILNSKSVTTITKAKDPLAALTTIGKNYTAKTMRGDFSILDTTHVEELYNHCQNVIIPRIYDRVNFFSEEKQDALKQLADDAIRESDPEEVTLTNSLFLEKEPKADDVNTNGSNYNATAIRTEVLRKAIQYEHSLYPSEVEDKQICDLYEYLADMVREELYGSDGAMRVREELDSRRPRHEKQQSDELISHVNPLDTIVPIDEDTAEVSSPKSVDNSKKGSSTCNNNIGNHAMTCEFIIPPRTQSPEMQGQLLSQEYHQAGSILHNMSPFPGLSSHGNGRGNGENGLHNTSKAQRALSLFHKVVVNYMPPKDPVVYATVLHGLSIVAPELSKGSKTLRRTNYHRQAFRRKAKEFLLTSKKGR